MNFNYETWVDNNEITLKYSSKTSLLLAKKLNLQTIPNKEIFNLCQCNRCVTLLIRVKLHF